jgi:1-acyl-sn-glycerol-3-phosphate acyltransferase
VVGISTPREVHFLAKEELFRFKPFGWLIRRLNAHPLNRKGDVAAFKLAQRILEEGYALIVFPEGRRSKTDHLAKPKAGVGLLAIRTGCPVVPTYIHNTGHLKKFRRAQVHFGSPLQAKSFHSSQAISEEVMRQIQRLKDRVRQDTPYRQ